MVHHYGSLDVIAQNAFALSRPNSKLAKEYEALRLQIVGRNFSDYEGALFTLRGISDRLEEVRKRRDDAAQIQIREEVLEIRSFHPNDGQIASLAAVAFKLLGDQPEEINALNVAVENGFDVDGSRLLRGFALLLSGEKEASLADFKFVVASTTASVYETIPALHILERLGEDTQKFVRLAFDKPDEQFQTLFSLLPYCMSHRELAPIVAKRMESLITSEDLREHERGYARNYSIISYISAREYQSASRVIESDPSMIDATDSFLDLFNSAITHWGLNGTPSKDMFAAFLAHPAMQGTITDVNGLQCVALAQAVLQEYKEAKRSIEAARRALNPGEKPFSCWRFLYVSSEEMLEDLSAMEKLIEKEAEVVPAFMLEREGVLH